MLHLLPPAAMVIRRARPAPPGGRAIVGRLVRVEAPILYDQLLALGVLPSCLLASTCCLEHNLDVAGERPPIRFCIAFAGIAPRRQQNLNDRRQ